MPLISSGAACLDEVARQGSVRRAAARLNASPSAVNRQILNLEAEYGVPLFERLPRGMRLTSAGELLVEEVRRWRRDHERARFRMEQLKGTSRGLVSVGTIECLSTEFVPTVFRDIQDRHPGIALSAFIDSTQQIVNALLSGALDLAISFTVPTTPGIEHIAEFEVPIGAVMAPDHRLARQSSLRLAEVARFPLLVPARSMPIRTAIDEAFASTSVAFTPVVTSNSTTLLKTMAKHGERVALISRIDAYAELRSGELKFVPIESRHLRQGPLSLSKRQGLATSPVINLVAESLRERLNGAVARVTRDL
jgi:DNA-binding transcriptional LysR family regulator